LKRKPGLDDEAIEKLKTKKFKNRKKKSKRNPDESTTTEKYNKNHLFV